jgi:hypothetical protein
MHHHPTFSTRVGNQGFVEPTGHAAAFPSVIQGSAESLPAAKNKRLHHDTAFLAERGCLGTVILTGHPVPTHQH